MTFVPSITIPAHKHPVPQRVVGYISQHKVSLGLFLASYGMFYLSVVIMSGWTLIDWGKDVTTYAPFEFSGWLPRSAIAPIFLSTALPALLIGSSLLIRYCICGLTAKTVEDRERVGIVLVAFGFIYVILGAWPLGKQLDFPWDWQKQIFSYGVIFTWMLYLLSIAVLAVGAVSVYRCSVFYHRKHQGLTIE
jgi:hypothetical protein